MLFNSLQFVLFFPIVTAVYFLLRNNTSRWAWLLLASCYFYMAFIPSYILILFLVIGIDYIAGIVLERSTGKRRKAWLIASLIANIGLLAVFKYFNFLNENVAFLAQQMGFNYSVPNLGMILPIGLSFHTFQSMSYTIEVYRGNYKAERNLLLYSLYVLFYPQLVAGPIERPQNVLPQFYKKYSFDYTRIVDGLKLMAWGLFKKVVIADRLAMYVDMVYNNPTDHQGWTVLLATYFFAFQIYCDFSGYSDIAIGAAQVMGLKLMKNFDRPYFSKTISEFWRRWHISLSTWFKDYMYIPLGGNRVGKGRAMLNLVIVFMISGLWHGASWTFIIWGALHGFYLVMSMLTKKLRHSFNHATGIYKYPSFMKWLDIVITFHLVAFAWIFFRAASVADAFTVIQNMFVGLGNLKVTYQGMGVTYLATAFGVIGIMELVHLLQRKKKIRTRLAEQPTVIRWAIYNFILLAILFFGVYTQQQFIYFQF